MNLKLVTWNMDFWQKQSHQAEAWKYLLEKVDADVYLVQEARPPEELMGDPNLLWFETNYERWGTGIYSKKYHIRHLPVQSVHPGAFVVAEASITDGLKLTIISLYGLFEYVGSDMYSTTTLHRMLSDLTGVLNGHMGGKRKIIFGGDLNASLQWDNEYGGRAHHIFFDRLANFNLENCWRQPDGLAQKPDIFVQTLRHPRSKIPWQNDYFFISKALSPNLKGDGCRALYDEDIERLSDHNPVLIELEL